MSGPAADTRRERAAGPVDGPLALTVALTVVLALGGSALALALVLTVDGPSPLPPPFGSQNQDAETLALVLAFAVALPAAAFAGPRLAAATAARAGTAGLSVIAALLAAALGGAVAVVRLAGTLGAPDGVRTVAVALAGWWLLAALALARPGWAARLGRWAAAAWALAAAAAAAAVVALTDLDSVSAAGLAAAALAAAAVLAGYGRLRVPEPLERWAPALEVAFVVALVLAVPDLLVFRPEDAPGNAAISLETAIITFHQNLLLGAANQVLGGVGMLVGSASQYGVGDIYALAGWFLVAPIGYGTFALIDAIWTALWFTAGYAVLRLAGVPRLPAAAALTLAVVALVFNLTYPVGALPQYGPLRFGMPMAILLAVVAGERLPRHARAARAATLVVAGVSALWSLEALAYTTVTYAALVAMQVWLDGPPARLRRLGRRALELVLAWAAAHALFALATLAATGELPDWGRYIDYLRAFLFGSVGDLTYDVPRWSPGLALGAGYLASAVALIELARRRHPLAWRARTAIVAMTGLTAYGIVLLSYWVDRSLEHILVHVALPGLLLATLWLALLLSPEAALALPRRRITLAAALALAVLVTGSAWTAIGDRFGRSALAHAAPGGESLHGALDRLWHPPPLKRAAGRGVAALERRMPGEDRSLVLVAPDLAVEILVRSGRIDRLLLADTWETSFVAADNLPELRRRIAALRPGTRMLVDGGALAVLRDQRAHPRADPLGGEAHGMAPLQRWALARIQARFRLRTVARQDEFEVLELAPLRP